MPLALITGGNSGIGAATALKLARGGFDLALTGRRIEKLEATAKEIAQKTGRKVFTYQFDIQDKEACLTFCEKFLKEHSQLDVLMNNAGLAKGTEKISDGKLEDWEQMMNTNVMGLLTITRGLLPQMLKQKSGIVINLGSAAGRWVYPGGAIYCATKFAVRAISEGIRMDTIGSGVRVCTIEPGMVETEFSVVRFGSQEKADKVYAGMKPLTAEDIAETIHWVIAQPKHVNIQEIVMFPTEQAAIGQVHRNN